MTRTRTQRETRITFTVNFITLSASFSDGSNATKTSAIKLFEAACVPLSLKRMEQRVAARAHAISFSIERFIVGRGYVQYLERGNCVQLPYSAFGLSLKKLSVTMLQSSRTCARIKFHLSVWEDPLFGCSIFGGYRSRR